MALKLKNKAAINKYILSFGSRIETALIFLLEAFVAELENHARNSAEYQDRTSNLKSSIGGGVIKDGKLVTYRGFENTGFANEGGQTGLEFLNSLISNYSSGYAIVLVAGMDYAGYVEDYYNLNVLKKTELKMRRELTKKVLNPLKQRIDKAA